MLQDPQGNTLTDPTGATLLAPGETAGPAPVAVITVGHAADIADNVNGIGSSPIPFTVPAGAAVGDLLVAVVTTQNAGASDFTAPDGWTTGPGVVGCRLIYHFLGVGETGTAWTAVNYGAHLWRVDMIVIRHVDPSVPLSSVVRYDSSGHAIWGSVTPAVAGSLAVGVGNFSSYEITPPAGYHSPIDVPYGVRLWDYTDAAAAPTVGWAGDPGTSPTGDLTASAGRYPWATVTFVANRQTSLPVTTARTRVTPSGAHLPVLAGAATLHVTAGTATIILPAAAHAPALATVHSTGHVPPLGATAVPVPQTFVMGPAISGPIAYGPFVSRPGFTPLPMAAYLFHRSDLVHPVTALDDAFGLTFQDRFSESGTATLSMANVDPDLAAAIDSECVVRYEIQGRAAFTAIVAKVERTAVSVNEELGEITTLSGLGHLSILNEALVYPSRGVGVVPAEDDRLFSWPSVDYDDSAWGAAPVISEGPGDPFYGQNIVWSHAAQWVDTVSRWMWASTTFTNPNHPGSGTCYFRTTFTVPAGVGKVAIYTAADDQAEVYVDGQLIASTNFLGGGEGEIQTTAVQASPGEHTIAVAVLNGFAPAGVVESPTRFNPGGLLVSVHAVVAGDPVDEANGAVVATPLLTSGPGWKIVEYPATPPGMTPGEVIRHVVTEAQARGAIPEVTLAFTDEVDSNGAPWPIVVDIATKVGTDLLTFVAGEMAATYVDLWMEPASFRLWAWIKNERGQGRNVTLQRATDPANPWSGNLAGLVHRTIR